MPKIHPTAIVHPTAVLSDDVEMGADGVVEADVVIGPGTVLCEHAILRRYTTIGRNNIVDSYAVLRGFHPRFAIRAPFSRIITDYNRDTDGFLGGLSIGFEGNYWKGKASNLASPGEPLYIFRFACRER